MTSMTRANHNKFAITGALHFLAIWKLADHYPCLVKMQFSAVLESNFSNTTTSCSIGQNSVAILLCIFNFQRKKLFRIERLFQKCCCVVCGFGGAG